MDEGQVATGGKRPAAVVATAILSVVYSLGLLCFSAQAAGVFASGKGSDNSLAGLGMIGTTVLALAGAGLLVGGGLQVWRGRYSWTTIVLWIVFVVSVIGNIADFAGGTVTTTSHVIGLTITIAALIPLLLLRTHRARRFAEPRREVQG